MEIFGGFMVMMSILSLFLAVVWLIMPFVVFAIKGKQDRTLEVLEGIDKRLSVIEAKLHGGAPTADTVPPGQQASHTQDANNGATASTDSTV
jgi:hypothetical protein